MPLQSTQMKKSFKEINQFVLSSVVQQGFIKPTVFYEIKGTFEINDQKYEIQVQWRYSDFFFLNCLILDEFYYCLLPIFPEKQFLLTIKPNMEKIELRRINLQDYLNSLVLNEKVKEFEPFVFFLTDK